MRVNRPADALLAANESRRNQIPTELRKRRLYLKSPEGKGTFIGSLTANELGLAFGRENVIHCALASGGLTKLVVEEAAKLKGFRGADGGKMPAKKDTKSR